MSHEKIPFSLQPEQEEAKTDQLNVPAFIYNFSKENSQEERRAVAAAIYEKRRERNAWRTAQEQRVKGKENIEIELENLREQIESYNNAGFLRKIKDYFEYRNTKTQLEEKAGILTTFQDDIDQAERTRPEFGEIKKLLNDFYRSEIKKWEEADYVPEDIEKNFSEENLTGLSLQEYAMLMRRFPGEMITHVTRQGIRDHTPSFWHTNGVDRFSNSFKEILKDGSLRSSFGIALQEHSKEEAVAKFLHLDNLDDLIPENQNISRRDKALLMYKSGFEYNLATSNAFADCSAVHFASENVMDEMYGSERGNEIFIAYPSAYVASQLNYGGKGTLTDTQANQHNDKWVYTKEHKGMPVDAGLVFIPQDARVDPRNGSRYEIGSDNNPIKNESAYKGLEKLAASPELVTIAQKIQEQLGNFAWKLPPSSTWKSELKRSEDRYAYVPHKEMLEVLLPVRVKIMEMTGITDERILEKVLNYRNITDLKNASTETSEYDRNIKTASAIVEILRQSGTYFIEAQNTISSKEYWDQYFVAHPDEKPSKVIFYSGGDPSNALNKWREENRIVKRTVDPTYGFPEHNVSDSSAEANEGKDRFASLARKIIDDRFPEPPVLAEEMAESE